LYLLFIETEENYCTNKNRDFLKNRKQSNCGLIESQSMGQKQNEKPATIDWGNSEAGNLEFRS